MLEVIYWEDVEDSDEPGIYIPGEFGNRCEDDMENVAEGPAQFLSPNFRYRWKSRSASRNQRPTAASRGKSFAYARETTISPLSDSPVSNKRSLRRALWSCDFEQPNEQPSITAIS